MGVVLEPTAAMGVWRTEVRRESAYLAGNTLVERGTGFALPVADIPCAVAAIDQIVAHPAYTQWRQRGGADAAEPWSTAVAKGWLRLFGPGHYYGGHDGPWSAGIVELTYEVLAAVRATLATHQEGRPCPTT